MIMSVKISTIGVALNVECVYAPQVGCREGEKKEFCHQLDSEIEGTPQEERIIISMEMNRLVGKERAVLSRIHDGRSVK